MRLVKGHQMTIIICCAGSRAGSIDHHHRATKPSSVRAVWPERPFVLSSHAPAGISSVQYGIMGVGVKQVNGHTVDSDEARKL